MTTQPQPLDIQVVLADLDARLAKVIMAEDHLLVAQQGRDLSICDARAAGMSATDLATRTGLSIQRVYQILAALA